MAKILQINSVVNFGSTGRIAENIGIKAIENGWESYIAYGRGNNNSKSKLIKIGNDWDIKFHGLQTRLFDRHGLGSIKATKKLIEKIKYIKPDIIHLHNIHGYYINIKILFDYLNSTDIPIVWTLHDCWSFTGHCSHFDYINCTKWKILCFRCPSKKSYPASYFKDRSKENFTLKKNLFTNKNITLIPVSNWLSNLLKSSYFKNNSIFPIKNGIDLSIFNPKDSSKIYNKNSLIDKFIILGVSSIWNKMKGLDDFIELSNNLDGNYIIILVGLSKKQIKKIPKRILGIERTENINELSDLYSFSNVFVNTTYQDTFPSVNLESLACGTPVITYNTGGSPEAIDNQTGIVVERGDIDGLVKAIEEIKQNGKGFYSQACISRAQKLFNKDDKFKEYIDIYNFLLNKKTENNKQ